MLLLLCRRTNHQHGHVSKHLIHRRASGEVAYRLREALEHRPVGIGMAEDLDQLDSDISCMEVGEVGCFIIYNYPPFLWGEIQ